MIWKPSATTDRPRTQTVHKKNTVALTSEGKSTPSPRDCDKERSTSKSYKFMTGTVVIIDRVADGKPVFWNFRWLSMFAPAFAPSKRQDCDILMRQIGLLSALLLVASTSSAFAYIDPGVGSIILQSLVAFIAAASVAISHYWQRIKNFFSADKEAPEPSERRTQDSD